MYGAGRRPRAAGRFRLWPLAAPRSLTTMTHTHAHDALTSNHVYLRTRCRCMELYVSLMRMHAMPWTPVRTRPVAWSVNVPDAGRWLLAL